MVAISAMTLRTMAATLRLDHARVAGRTWLPTGAETTGTDTTPFSVEGRTGTDSPQRGQGTFCVAGSVAGRGTAALQNGQAVTRVSMRRLPCEIGGVSTHCWPSRCACPGAARIARPAVPLYGGE